MGDSSSSSNRTTGAIDQGNGPPTSLPIFFNIQSFMAHCHLNSENYPDWSSLFTSVLDMHKLTFTITQSNPHLTHLSDKVTKNPDHEIFSQASGLVCGWIKATVTADVQPYVNPCQTALEAWALLAKEFNVASPIHLQRLQDDFHDLSRTPEMTMKAYILRAKTLSNSLAKACEPVSFPTLKHCILGGLGSSFKEFVTVQNSNGAASLEDLQDLLLQEEVLQQKYQATTISNTTIALAASKIDTPLIKYPISTQPNPVTPQAFPGVGNFNPFGFSPQIKTQGRGGSNNRSRGKNWWKKQGRGHGLLQTPPSPFSFHPNFGPVLPHNPPTSQPSFSQNQPSAYSPPNSYVSIDPNQACQICFRHSHTAQTYNNRHNSAYLGQYQPFSSPFPSTVSSNPFARL